MYIPTGKSYFSGAGGMDIGMMRAGINIIQSLDLDKKATDCMAMNPQYFSHPVVTQDIKEITVFEQQKSDIIIGTYPCNKYSAIADIHQTRTGEDLYLHLFRHIALEQPEVYVLENVPGMKKFKVVMEAMTRLPGYYVNLFCPLDAGNWLPQKRNRLILIGTKKPFSISAPGKAKKRPTLKSMLEISPDVNMPQCVLNRLYGLNGYRDRPIIVDPEDKDAMAPTCLAHYSKDLGTRLVKDKTSKHGVRPFTVREYARLQGFPDDYAFPDTLDAYRLIGNAVAIDMAHWAGKEVMRYFN